MTQTDNCRDTRGKAIKRRKLRNAPFLGWKAHEPRCQQPFDLPAVPGTEHLNLMTADRSGDSAGWDTNMTIRP